MILLVLQARKVIIHDDTLLFTQSESVENFLVGSGELGARLQGGRTVEMAPILRDLKKGFIFIFMDDVANFGYSCEQKFSYESFQGLIKSIAKINDHKLKKLLIRIHLMNKPILAPPQIICRKAFAPSSPPPRQRRF